MCKEEIDGGGAPNSLYDDAFFFFIFFFFPPPIFLCGLWRISERSQGVTVNLGPKSVTLGPLKIETFSCHLPLIPLMIIKIIYMVIYIVKDITLIKHNPA